MQFQRLRAGQPGRERLLPRGIVLLQRRRLRQRHRTSPRRPAPSRRSAGATSRISASAQSTGTAPSPIGAAATTSRVSLIFSFGSAKVDPRDAERDGPVVRARRRRRERSTAGCRARARARSPLPQSGLRAPCARVAAAGFGATVASPAALRRARSSARICSRDSGPRRYDIAQRLMNVTRRRRHGRRAAGTRACRATTASCRPPRDRASRPTRPSRPSSTRALSRSVWSRPRNHVPALPSPL